MKEFAFEPMTIGRILDYVFKIYKENFVRFVAIVAVVVVPIQLLTSLSQGLLFTDLFEEDQPYTAEYEPEDAAAVETPDVGEYGQEEYIYEESSGPNPLLMILGGIGSTVAVFLALIGSKLTQGALTHSVSQYYLGTEVSVGEAYRYVGKRLLRLIGAAILVGLIVFGGFLLFVVPGVIFALWYAIVVPIIIAEDCTIGQALSRSKSLVKGNLGKVFGLGLLIWLIGMIVQVPFAFLGQLVSSLLMGANQALGFMVSQFVNIIGNVIVAPIGAAAYILLYYDLRIRKEGFDLEMLADSVHDDQSLSTNAGE